jgi:hypothetical protein
VRTLDPLKGKSMRIDANSILHIPAGLFTVFVGVMLGLVVVTQDAAAGPFTAPGHLPAEMAAWATSVDDSMAGPVDIAQPGLGIASFGLPTLVLGPSLTGGSAGSSDVFSLGDGGFITLVFEAGIADGIGNDFAVFENGFVDQGSGFFFGEFAFVEVSSNGFDFVRFPATSLQATPVSAFGVVDPSDYHNFAGDQMIGVGTGFDLHELIDDPLVQGASVALTDIRFVRIVDVIGDGSTFDQAGEAIFDPYATAFAAGGFDAEAVGVLHTAPEPAGVLLLASGVITLVAAARVRGRQRSCASRR